MTKRNRKLIGAFTIIAYVVVYALLAMALAQSATVRTHPSSCRGSFMPCSACSGSCR